MYKKRPIIIVEDDLDDQEIMDELMKELNVPHERIFFSLADDAFQYLKQTTDQPFIILCDINLPIVNGLEFKRRVDEDDELRQKSIPFIFLSTSADKRSVNEAYTKLTVQGFFKKESSMPDLKRALSVIMEYWNLTKHPNSC